MGLLIHVTYTQLSEPITSLMNGRQHDYTWDKRHGKHRYLSINRS